LSIFSVTLKSAITPFFKGLTTMILPGRAAQHFLGLLADGLHFTGTFVESNG
jgi:hypothetical protein